MIEAYLKFLQGQIKKHIREYFRYAGDIFLWSFSESEHWQY